MRAFDIFKLFNCVEDGKLSEEVIQKLVEWGLIPKEGEYKCKNGHVLKLVKSECIDGWKWKCFEKIKKNNKKRSLCRAVVSLRTGTFFERSKLTVFQIVVFVYFWTKNSPLNFIKTEISISLKTAVGFNSFCREVCVFGSFQTNLVIGGTNIVVEIDEIKLGRRKYHRGHRVDGQWIFGGVERETGKSFMIPVESRSREVLVPLIKRYVRAGSIIVSDCWKAYDTLSEEGYIHHKVNHSVSFRDERSGQHTNTIEGLWRHLERSIPEYNRRKAFYDGYVQKFIFLRWCRASKQDPFLKFLNFAGMLYNPLNPLN